MIVANNATFLSLGDFTNPETLLAAFGFLIICSLSVRNTPGAILIGVMLVTILSILLGLIEFQGLVSMPPSIAPTFMKMDILGALDIAMLSVVMSFLFVNLFDTAGTLLGVATRAKITDEFGNAKNFDKALKADIIFCSGASLEVGWLPLLLQKAKGSVQPGTEGYLMAFEYVKVLEKTTVADRSMGDIHPEGNPHVHLNPHNISLIAKELAKRLELIDTTNQSFYRSRFDNFTLRWKEAINRWEKNSSVLKGMQVVIHHKTFSYLIDWLGLIEVGSLEAVSYTHLTLPTKA